MPRRKAQAAAGSTPDRSDTDGVRLRLGIEAGDAASRVAAWRDAMAPTGRVMLTPEEADRFIADMAAYRFDDLMAVRVQASDHRLVRTRAMAAARPLDHVLVNVTQAGCVRGRTGRRRLEVGMGAMAVQRLSSPMDVRFEAATWLGLIVPCATWDREVGPSVPADGWAYTADSPEAVLLGGLLGSLHALPDSLEGVRRSQVARSCLAVLRETLGSPAIPGRRTNAAGRARRGTREAKSTEETDETGVLPAAVPLAQAIRRYVGANLHDPALGMDTICRHFALSRTTLRRIMGPASGDVARIIRRWRLHEAHREIIASNALAYASEPSVLSIGERWGFEQERSFRRAFVREFGMAPMELRRRVRQGEIAPLPDAGRLFERWFQGAE